MICVMVASIVALKAPTVCPCPTLPPEICKILLAGRTRIIMISACATRVKPVKTHVPEWPAQRSKQAKWLNCGSDSVMGRVLGRGRLNSAMGIAL